MQYRLHIIIQYFFIIALVLILQLQSKNSGEPDTIRLRLMSKNILNFLGNVDIKTSIIRAFLLSMIF